MTFITAGPRPLMCYCAQCGFVGIAQRVETIAGIVEAHLLYCAVRQLRADVDRERSSAVVGPALLKDDALASSAQSRTEGG